MRTPDSRRPGRARSRASAGAVADRPSDLGQTAIVAVLAVILIIGVIGGMLVATVVQSGAAPGADPGRTCWPTGPSKPGENAYVTAINANPSLAQCSTNTNNTGTCTGIDYGEWNQVAAVRRPAASTATPSTTPSATPSRRSTRPPTPSPTWRSRSWAPPRARHVAQQLHLRHRDHQPGLHQRVPDPRLVVELRVVQPDRRLLEAATTTGARQHLQHQRQTAAAAVPSTSVPTTTCSARPTPTTPCSSAATDGRSRRSATDTSPPCPRPSRPPTPTASSSTPTTA